MDDELDQGPGLSSRPPLCLCGHPEHSHRRAAASGDVACFVCDGIDDVDSCEGYVPSELVDAEG